MGSLFEHLVSAEETDGLVSMAMVTQPPGIATPLHLPGDGGSTSPVPGLLAAPGGLMGMYDEVGIPASERRLPGTDATPMDVEIARWNEVAPRYGLEVVGPPLPA